MRMEKPYNIMFNDMFKNIINSIGKDKWIHFTFSLLILLFPYFICHACGVNVWVVAP